MRRAVSERTVGLVPHIFRRVEFRSIRWKAFDVKSPMLGNILFDLFSQMD